MMGHGSFTGSQTSESFTIVRENTSVSWTAPLQLAQGGTATLSGRLLGLEMARLESHLEDNQHELAASLARLRDAADTALEGEREPV
jgi:hypothetical protein